MIQWFEKLIFCSILLITACPAAFPASCSTLIKYFSPVSVFALFLCPPAWFSPIYLRYPASKCSSSCSLQARLWSQTEKLLSKVGDKGIWSGAGESQVGFKTAFNWIVSVLMFVLHAYIWFIKCHKLFAYLLFVNLNSLSEKRTNEKFFSVFAHQFCCSWKSKEFETSELIIFNIFSVWDRQPNTHLHLKIIFPNVIFCILLKASHHLLWLWHLFTASVFDNHLHQWVFFSAIL